MDKPETNSFERNNRGKQEEGGGVEGEGELELPTLAEMPRVCRLVAARQNLTHHSITRRNREMTISVDVTTAMLHLLVLRRGIKTIRATIADNQSTRAAAVMTRRYLTLHAQSTLHLYSNNKLQRRCEGETLLSDINELVFVRYLRTYTTEHAPIPHDRHTPYI